MRFDLGLAAAEDEPSTAKKAKLNWEDNASGISVPKIFKDEIAERLSQANSDLRNVFNGGSSTESVSLSHENWHTSSCVSPQ